MTAGHTMVGFRWMLMSSPEAHASYKLFQFQTCKTPFKQYIVYIYIKINQLIYTNENTGMEKYVKPLEKEALPSFVRLGCFFDCIAQTPIRLPGKRRKKRAERLLQKKTERVLRPFGSLFQFPKCSVLSSPAPWSQHRGVSGRLPR